MDLALPTMSLAKSTLSMKNHYLYIASHETYTTQPCGPILSMVLRDFASLYNQRFLLCFHRNFTLLSNIQQFFPCRCCNLRRLHSILICNADILPCCNREIVYLWRIKKSEENKLWLFFFIRSWQKCIFGNNYAIVSSFQSLVCLHIIKSPKETSNIPDISNKL